MTAMHRQSTQARHGCLRVLAALTLGTIAMSCSSDAPTAATVAPTTTQPPRPTTAPTTTAVPILPATPTSADCPTDYGTDITCWTVPVAVDPAAPTGAAMDLFVATRQSAAGVWNSPVLYLSGALPTQPLKQTPSHPLFAGHDLVAVDHRGAGLSDGAVTCPTMTKYQAEVQTGRYSEEAIAALQACFETANSSAIPFASLLDNAVTAADMVAVRQAFGIEKWSLWASSGGADIAVHLIDQDPEAISSVVTHSPQAVGLGVSANTIADAFDRFAGDCAWVESCSSHGDLRANLELALTRHQAGVTTNTRAPETDRPVVLDAGNLQAGTRVALGDPTLAPLLPTLLQGLADGSGEEAVAGYFASTAIDDNVVALAGNCQKLDYYAPGMEATLDDHGGPFVGIGTHQECDKLGPVPQYSPPPRVQSDIPVLVVQSAYNPRSSQATSRVLFGGFSNAQFITVPGVANAALEMPECFNEVAAAFMTDPVSADTWCLTQSTFATLGTRAARPTNVTDTTFSYLQPPVNELPQTCTSDKLGCAGILPSGIETVTGDWTGDLVNAVGSVGGAVADDPNGFQFTSAALRAFNGTAGTCGTGSVVIATTDDELVADGNTGVAETQRSYWWIVTSTGTGDLTAMTGGGTMNVTPDVGGGANVGFTGWLDCTGTAPSPVPRAQTSGDRVSFSFTTPAASSGDIVCAPGSSTACASIRAVVNTFTGALNGEGASAVATATTAGADAGQVIHGDGAFSGTLTGCGIGTVVIDTYAEFSEALADAGADFVTVGYWEIVPKFGTGDLATATGNGVLHATFDGDSTTVDYEGTINCSGQ